VVLAVPAAAQDFAWNGTVPAGQVIEIKGINGDIRAVAASGGQVRVTAVKDADDDDPEEVRIEVVEHAGGVTICAVYPARRGREPNECRPGRAGRNSSHDNDVEVEFRVEVPRGVRLAARTVNGDVEAASIAADVDARTVNGDVRVSTDGIARAGTVNGSLDIAMGRSDWSDDLEFSTVNGGITVRIAGELNAEVSASTVNGDIETAFPLTVQGRWGPRRMRGTVGTGGRELSLSTVNGSIALERR
jgi:hypothetical protein